MSFFLFFKENQIIVIFIIFFALSAAKNMFRGLLQCFFLRNTRFFSEFQESFGHELGIQEFLDLIVSDKFGISIIFGIEQSHGIEISSKGEERTFVLTVLKDLGGHLFIEPMWENVILDSSGDHLLTDISIDRNFIRSEISINGCQLEEL